MLVNGKKIVYFLLLFSSLLGLKVEASGVAVSPTIVDEIVGARGMIERDIVITNNQPGKVSLYPFVNDVSESGGKQPFNAYAPDKSLALSNWVDFSRKTIELMPGATATVPLKIHVHPLAKEGKYYAVLSLIHASNRPDAESRLASNPDSVVMLNVEIKENKIERSEIVNFNVGSFFNFNKQALLQFDVHNSGNQPVVTQGSIVIYDGRGREVSELKVNEEGKRLVADENERYKINWESGNKVGKFKAKLSLHYGDAIKRDMQDSVYFWVLPRWFLLMVGLIILTLFVSILMLILRLNRYKKSLIDDERGEIINLRDR
jgi:hypothetical protein